MSLAGRDAPRKDRPATSRKAALDRYVGYLQDSLSAIDARAHWRIREAGEAISLFTTPDPLVLDRESSRPGTYLSIPPDRLFMTASQLFRVIEVRPDHGSKDIWKVATDGYSYIVSPVATMADELFAWQWKRSEASGPHVHVGASHKEIGHLGKIHIPTSRIAFEQVCLFLIGQCGVIPAKDRAEAILLDVLDRFTRYRTWAGSGPPSTPK